MASMKLKGSTLIEVIVSMLIIMISFGMAMLIVINLFKSAAFEKKLKARIITNNMIADTKINGLYIDRDTLIDGMDIIQKTSVYSSQPALKTLMVQVRSLDGKIIYEQKQVVCIP